MASDGTLNRLLIAMRDNDEQIHIAVFVGRSPGMRAEQNDLFRLKLCDQPLGHLLEKPLGQLFHLSLKLHQPTVRIGFEAALNAGNLVKQALGDPTDAAVVDGDGVSLVEQLADR